MTGWVQWLQFNPNNKTVTPSPWMSSVLTIYQANLVESLSGGSCILSDRVHQVLTLYHANLVESLPGGSCMLSDRVHQVSPCTKPT